MVNKLNVYNYKNWGVFTSPKSNGSQFKEDQWSEVDRTESYGQEQLTK